MLSTISALGVAQVLKTARSVLMKRLPSGVVTSEATDSSRHTLSLARNG